MIDDGRPSLLSAHRPSVLLATGGDLRCDLDATQLARPAEEALKRALSVLECVREGEIGCILGNVTSSKDSVLSAALPS